MQMVECKFCKQRTNPRRPRKCCERGHKEDLRRASRARTRAILNQPHHWGWK